MRYAHSWRNRSHHFLQISKFTFCRVISPSWKALLKTARWVSEETKIPAVFAGKPRIQMPDTTWHFQRSHTAFMPWSESFWWLLFSVAHYWKSNHWKEKYALIKNQKASSVSHCYSFSSELLYLCDEGWLINTWITVELYLFEAHPLNTHLFSLVRFFKCTELFQLPLILLVSYMGSYVVRNTIGGRGTSLNEWP